jgi:hypothetical protein
VTCPADPDREPERDPERPGLEPDSGLSFKAFGANLQGDSDDGLWPEV